MPKVAYSLTQKAQAVALASVIGADAAGAQLGITPRAIRGWMEKAGKVPADAITSADWATLGDLARTQVQASLASGKVRPKDAAVIAAIADRNAAKVEPMPEPLTPEEDWWHAVNAALLERHKGHATTALIALIEWFDTLVDTLDPDGPAPTVEECIAYLKTVGDLSDWQARRAAASHEAMLVQLEKNRVVQAEWTRPKLDPETQALLAEAEAWLSANREVAP